jgi:hypothetical protein
MLCLGLPPKTGFAITRDSNSTADWNPMSSGFFESPHGLAFLHHLLCALHLVVGQANDGGIRNICWLLELCQLDRFVATSYGAQQAVAANIEKAIQQFGQEERARLAKQMSHREITLCEDETFHPQSCLVAIEPVSNYLILEEYAAKRDAATWNAAISEAFQPLSVTVTQCVSDQATALISHAQTYLGVDRGCLDESTCFELLPCCCRESLQRLKGTQTTWRTIAFYSDASQISRWSSIGLK